MAGTTALALGVFSGVKSIIQTNDANKQAGQVQQQEQQLLNEANQQASQQAEQGKLIEQRTGQEQALNPVNPKFSGTNTILTGPLGIPAQTKSTQQLQLLGT